LCNTKLKKCLTAASIGVILLMAAAWLAPWSASKPGVQRLDGRTSVSDSCGRPGAAVVRTNRSKYPHHALVRITGSGYGPGCHVAVRVIRPDGAVALAASGRGAGDAIRADGGTVAANASGNFSSHYRLGAIDGRYVVEAVGARGRVLAHADFMDASVVTSIVDWIKLARQ